MLNYPHIFSVVNYNPPHSCTAKLLIIIIIIIIFEMKIRVLSAGKGNLTEHLHNTGSHFKHASAEQRKASGACGGTSACGPYKSGHPSKINTLSHIQLRRFCKGRIDTRPFYAKQHLLLLLVNFDATQTNTLPLARNNEAGQDEQKERQQRQQQPPPATIKLVPLARRLLNNGVPSQTPTGHQRSTSCPVLERRFVKVRSPCCS